tara:strand:+ start:397 stop:642 length:246 start_codon:yes stop_codon:yes gene_type:complete
MKYNNVIVDIKPRPVLEELISDLTNKMLNLKKVLRDNRRYADTDIVDTLESNIQLLDEVIERCYAQQELINMRNEQLIGLN